MNIDEFKTLYNELYGDNVIIEGKLLNSLLAGTALTAGTVLGLGKLSEIDNFDKNTNLPIVQKTETPEIEKTDKNSNEADIEIKNNQEEKQQSNSLAWINDIAMPFILEWEGSVTNFNGDHIVYDDDVSRVIKRRWNGKGGQAGIDAFIKSCVGKPTIGYGETNIDIVRKGKISDSDAIRFLQKRIINLYKFLKNTYEHFNNMNPNQKTALISFSYNLGKHFIETRYSKIKKIFNFR